MFFKNGVLKNFAKFTGKHLCRNLFFNKVADLRPAILLKQDAGAGVSCDFCEIFKNTFFVEHLRRLLLLVQNHKVLLTVFQLTVLVVN